MQNAVILQHFPMHCPVRIALESVSYKDSRSSISFETVEIIEESLLRLNCLDSEYDYMGSGWGDLRLYACG